MSDTQQNDSSNGTQDAQPEGVLKRNFREFMDDPMGWAMDRYIWLIMAGVAVGLIIAGGKSVLQSFGIEIS